MIFFLDPNSSTTKAKVRWREIQKNASPDLTDQERIDIVNKFVEDHRNEYGKFPPAPVLERCANFILTPYTSNKEEEYKILSVYTMERHRSREQQLYEDSIEYK